MFTRWTLMCPYCDKPLTKRGAPEHHATCANRPNTTERYEREMAAMGLRS